MPIQQYAPEFSKIVSTDQSITMLTDGYGGDEGPTEGPLWWKEGGYLLFSDIHNDRRMRYTPGQGPVVEMQPNNRANGLTRDLQGRLIACEPTDDMVSRLDTKEMTITVDRDIEDLPDGLKDYPVELLDGRRLRFSFPPSRINSGEILNAVQSAGLKIIDVATREAELEDIFLKLTGQLEPDEP